MLLSAVFMIALLQSSLAFQAPRRSSTLLSMVVSSYDLGVRSSSSRASNTLLDPLVVCGPSGVGKGTIIQRFMESHQGQQFGFTVSHTTRAPRQGEVDGIHYHFVDETKMRREIAEGKFLEYAQVHGNWYGTSWASLQDLGKRALLDIDVQGVRNIKGMEEAGVLEPKYIFIAPPSLETLRTRLQGRQSESPESLERRLGNAASEVEYGLEAGNFDAIVTNDDLDQAVQDFAQAVRALYQEW